MKTFQVSLAKTYTVSIVADEEEQARRLAEFYTGDIQDISTEKERQSKNFSIQEIECQINEAIDCTEIENE